MAGRSRDYQTIGEVVRSLNEAYPDLTVSKVRFLEEEGLICPERTLGGYRKFSTTDITRIEFILRMQKEHFLPLAVIRERLTEIDHGKIPEELRSSAGSAEAISLPFDEDGTVPVENARQELGVPPEFVRELEDFGLVKPMDADGRPELSRADVEIVHASWDLRRFGVEPRHLKMFEGFAEREAGLLAQILTPAARLRTPEARQKVVSQLEEISGLTDELKRHLLRRALAGSFDDVT